MSQTRISIRMLPAPDGLRAAAVSVGRSLLTAGGTAALLLGIWALGWAAAQGDFPTPISIGQAFWSLVRDPFYDQGPNDKGIGLQLAASLGRVLLGFGLGALVAVPVGVLMGASPMWNRVIHPVVQVLRPVSPLAWFPLGLAVLKNAQNATVFAIFITALWPTVINTAFGVASLPREYRQVAQVFRFSRAQFVLKILLPYSLPHIATGLRLSMGVAWMVIVAGEMLSGGTGIGFFVWDSWNALNLDYVISAIIVIGLIGLALDRAFESLARRVSYGS